MDRWWSYFFQFHLPYSDMRPSSAMNPKSGQQMLVPEAHVKTEWTCSCLFPGLLSYQTYDGHVQWEDLIIWYATGFESKCQMNDWYFFGFRTVPQLVCSSLLWVTVHLISQLLCVLPERSACASHAPQSVCERKEQRFSHVFVKQLEIYDPSVLGPQ